MSATRRTATILSSLAKRSSRRHVTRLLSGPEPRSQVNALTETRHYTTVPQPQTERVRLTIIMRDGRRQEVSAKVGQNMLDVVLENKLDIDGFGACEATLACSTCHLIFKEENYSNFVRPADEELDMLDLASGVSNTSRLGCQVRVTKAMDGAEILVPTKVSDARGSKY